MNTQASSYSGHARCKRNRSSCVYKTWCADRSCPSKQSKGDLANVKDPLPQQHFPGVVYKIPCTDCECIYVEESNLYSCLKQHEKEIAKGHKVTSALAELAEKTGNGEEFDYKAQSRINNNLVTKNQSCFQSISFVLTLIIDLFFSTTFS